MRFLRLMLLVATAMLVGCGGSGGGGGASPSVGAAPAGPIPLPTSVTYNVLGLSVTPAQLTFSSTGATPATQTATLAVNGSASSYTTQIDYSPSVTDWLQVRPSIGTPDLSNGSQTLTFNVNPAGLPA